jgi:two-component system, OmpR family, sensor histidine kinase KdpD
VAEGSLPRRGRLKVFLGYAAGVGKTYQMLTEARALRAAGVDVVIGYFEPHGRRDTIALTEGLESVATRPVEYRGSTFQEMDTDAVLARRPQVAVVDEFPHTNVPGSPRGKRWEDVHLLLDAGLDVLTTMNIQHVESLNDQIWRSTGVRVRETIPDWVLSQADEIVMVDLAPAALLNRLARGVVYPPERAMVALQHFFKESTLVALRELAMRQTAQALEGRYTHHDPAESAAGSEPHAAECIVLLIEPHPGSAVLIRRGRRVADYLKAECFAVSIERPAGREALEASARDALERQLNFARGLRIETRVLEGDDVAETLVGFARRNRATQIFVLRHRTGGLTAIRRRGLVQRIVALATDMQVTVVADRSVRAGGSPGA